MKHFSNGRDKMGFVSHLTLFEMAETFLNLHFYFLSLRGYRASKLLVLTFEPDNLSLVPERVRVEGENLPLQGHTGAWHECTCIHVHRQTHTHLISKCKIKE